MAEFPKVESVEPIQNKRLRVTFANGEVRVYDCTPLLASEAFRALKDEAFFRNVHADKSGYGVAWNDDVDLAESELWLHGASGQGVDTTDRQREHWPETGVEDLSSRAMDARRRGQP